MLLNEKKTKKSIDRETVCQMGRRKDKVAQGN